MIKDGIKYDLWHYQVRRLHSLAGIYFGVWFSKTKRVEEGRISNFVFAMLFLWLGGWTALGWRQQWLGVIGLQTVGFKTSHFFKCLKR